MLPAVLLVSALDAVPAGAQSPPQGEVAKRFFGAWRYVGTSIDGKPRPGRGGRIPRASSTTIRAAPWRRRSRPTGACAWPARSPRPRKPRRALADYVAYFGTYTIDERAGTITHHRQASVQPGELTDYVRSYEFAGDRLILRPVGTKQEVVWERFK